MKFGPCIGFLFCLLLSASPYATTYNLTVNGNTKQGDVPHFWSRCVGTGGAQLCTDVNWKAHAKIAVEEAGFKAFRGHRILSASNPITWSGSGSTPTYNWAAFDKIYDFLVDTLGTIPIMELSSMPTPLQTSGEWSPPKDYSVWQDMINKLVAHCITRWGKEKVRTWFFEVWNEWDYSGFWSGGTESNYYQLYKAAVTGAKAADSLIQVGGPASTASNRLAGMLSYCKTNNLPIDGLTNHTYGQSGTSESLPTTIRNDNRSRADAIKGFGKKLVSMNTEYNTSYSGQGGNTVPFCLSMDSHVNAPFVTKCVKLILDDAPNYQLPDVLSYWAVSDVFDEGSWYSSHPNNYWGQVFGLINQFGIRKAAFNAFKLLHMMGTQRIQLTGTSGSTAINPDNDGVDGFATINADGSQVAVMCYNYYNSLGAAVGNDFVNLTINNLPLAKGQITVTHYRVDSLHSNPYAEWIKQGKPTKSSTTAMDQIKAASNLAELVPQKTFDYTGAAYTDTFTLARQGVSLLLFKSKTTAARYAPKIPDEQIFSASQGRIIASTRSGKNGLVLSIFNLDGQLVQTYKTSQRSVELREIIKNKGVYLVSARAGERRITTKFIRTEK